MRRVPGRMLRHAAFAAAFAISSISAIGSAYADVTGHLRLIVKSGAAPIKGAKVTFHDTAEEKPDVVVETDAEGEVLSPPLENRDWTVTVESGGSVIMSQVVTVVADTVTDVDVAAAAAPPGPGEKPNATVNLIRKAQTVLQAIRTKNFAELFPVAAGKPFSLEGILRTIPGFTSGATGQLFARGDQALGSILVNGLKLPGSFAGQFGDNITANLVSNLEAMTGGLPAEYASLASSVLNVNLKGGTMQPKNGFNLLGGTFATFDGSVVLSGQLGKQMGEPDPSGRVARNLAYFVNFSDRRTGNVLQGPQPQEEESNNRGEYNNFFGNFDYKPNQKDQWMLLVNHAPTMTDVANRAGLPSGWPTGGYGFGGLFDNRVRRGKGGMPSQEEMGLDVHENAVNNFGLMSWRRKENENTDWMLSFGSSHVGNDMGHNNPSIDMSALPFNSSQEYNPNIDRNNRSWQSQGHFRRKTGKHDFKIGYFLDEHNGLESYQMIPASIIALNALYAADPRLAPPATPVLVENPNGGLMPLLDPLGNPTYTPTGGPAPILRSALKRHNRSFFAQDDWNPSDRLSVNFGARWDSFQGQQSLGMSDAEDSMISPRVNASFKYDHRSVIRASYNRLFQAPPMVQGFIVGANPMPATTDQLDLSFERSLGPTSSFKISGFHKKSKDQIYIRQLIQYLQNGPLAAVNLDDTESRGIEVSALMTPIEGKGISGFFTWTNGSATSNGMTSEGAPAPDDLPADQRNTITAGMNYMWANGANWALSWDFGSGLPSADVFGTGRKQQSRMNFRFQSAGSVFGPFGGFTLDVENLFDSHTVIGFNSPVNGTRFQQGRRITFSAFSQFLTR